MFHLDNCSSITDHLNAGILKSSRGGWLKKMQLQQAERRAWWEIFPRGAPRSNRCVLCSEVNRDKHSLKCPEERAYTPLAFALLCSGRADGCKCHKMNNPRIKVWRLCCAINKTGAKTRFEALLKNISASFLSVFEPSQMSEGTLVVVNKAERSWSLFLCV